MLKLSDACRGAEAALPRVILVAALRSVYTHILYTTVLHKPWWKLLESGFVSCALKTFVGLACTRHHQVFYYYYCFIVFYYQEGTCSLIAES